MKKTIAAAAFAAGVSLSPVAQAQVVSDMALITCKQMTEMPDERMPFVTAWMAGYYGATQNRSTIDLRYLERNVKVVHEYCKKHHAETLMSAIEKTAK
jgi:acid stress chaperone HdeB